MTDLRSLVAGVLAPGFNGTSVPGWLRTAINDGLGSVVLFGHNMVGTEGATGLDQVAALTSDLRRRRDAADPLLIAADEEGGDVTRIEVGRGSSLPGAAAIGAIGDLAVTRELATAHGRLLRALGIDSGLAPVADVNSNPANPVIGVRSFGADAAAVAEHVVGYVEGLQSAGVLACVKHFPGHGDAGVDSHHELPSLIGTMADLQQRELVPFLAAIRAGVAAVMPGHLVVPAVDEEPASISPRWTEILRQEMGFAGLTITDALDMQAVAARYGVPGAAVQALRAGADLLCLGNTAEIDDEQMYLDCMDAILAALADGRLQQESLARSHERRRTALQRLAPTGPVVQIADAATALQSAGRLAAERAILVDPAIAEKLSAAAEAPAVIDLRSGGTMAAGPVSRRLPAALRTCWPQLVDVAVAELAEIAGDRPLLVLLRSAAPGTTERAELDRLLALRPDAVLVHTGWPAAAVGLENRRTVFSYGNAAVNIAVLCERLTGGR